MHTRPWSWRRPAMLLAAGMGGLRASLLLVGVAGATYESLAAGHDAERSMMLSDIRRRADEWTSAAAGSTSTASERGPQPLFSRQAAEARRWIGAWSNRL